MTSKKPEDLKKKPRSKARSFCIVLIPEPQLTQKNAFVEIMRRACVRKKLSHRHLWRTFIIE